MQISRWPALVSTAGRTRHFAKLVGIVTQTVGHCRLSLLAAQQSSCMCGMQGRVHFCVDVRSLSPTFMAIFLRHMPSAFLLYNLNGKASSLSVILDGSAASCAMHEQAMQR
jgi:hypothetical protein